MNSTAVCAASTNARCPAITALPRCSWIALLVSVTGSIGSLNTTRNTPLGDASLVSGRGSVRTTTGAVVPGGTAKRYERTDAVPDDWTIAIMMVSPATAASGTGSNPPSVAVRLVVAPLRNALIVATVAVGSDPAGSDTYTV